MAERRRKIEENTTSFVVSSAGCVHQQQPQASQQQEVRPQVDKKGVQSGAQELSNPQQKGLVRHAEQEKHQLAQSQLQVSPFASTQPSARSSAPEQFSIGDGDDEATRAPQEEYDDEDEKMRIPMLAVPELPTEH